MSTTGDTGPAGDRDPGDATRPISAEIGPLEDEIGSLEDEIGSLEDTGRAHAREVVRLTLENSRLRSDLDAADRARLAAVARLGTLHAAHEGIARLRAEADADAERARAGHEAREALEARLVAAERSASALSDALALVRASSSWRLTRPWRFVGRLARRASARRTSARRASD